MGLFYYFAAIVGIDARATMDMDATIRGFELNEDKLKNVFNEILSIPVDDGVFMRLSKTSTNRGTFENIKNYSSEYIRLIESSEVLLNLWERYRSNNKYASGISVVDTVNSMKRTFSKTNLS